MDVWTDDPWFQRPEEEGVDLHGTHGNERLN